jgi:acyl-CoA:acyl-CoA alkyltransferase
MWGRDILPSTAGAIVVKKALDQAEISTNQVGALLSCSVCRDLFEPSTACIIHGKIGLPHSTLTFDITNACIGFSNGLMVGGQLIDNGVVDKVVVVSAENPAIIIDSNFALVEREKDTITRERFLRILPTFTLGCGAVAFVLSRADKSKSTHRLISTVALTASEHAELCSGNGDFCLTEGQGIGAPVMETESSKLIAEAAILGSEAWKELSTATGWKNQDLEQVICHQVGRQVNEGFYKTMGLPFEKDFSIYQEYGNMVSAALPTALTISAESSKYNIGDKIILTAFGSGLNAVFTAVEW